MLLSNELVAIAGHPSQVARVRTLIADGVDVNTKGATGDTLLIQAAKRGSLSTVMMLIQAGAYLNTTDQDGHQALYWACRYRQSLAVVHCLIVAGAQPNGSLSVWLADWPSANVERSFTLEGKPFLYPGGIVAATRQGRVDAVKGFITQGFNVNDPDEHGVTAIMLTAASPALYVLLAELLAAAADVNSVDHNGRSVLAHAVGRTFPEYQIIHTLRILFEAGALYPSHGPIEADPLYTTASAGCLALVQYLAPYCPLAILLRVMQYAPTAIRDWIYHEMVWREHRGLVVLLSATQSPVKPTVQSWVAHRAPYTVRRGVITYLPMPL